MKTPSPEKTSVVIVEDHPMFREQLAHLISKEPDMAVCGEADNVHDGFTLIKEKNPAIAIVDITLKGSSGLELLKDLRAHGIELPTLVLSMHDESLYAERALRAGAKGYITKHEASANVMVAIRQVLSGEIYLKPRFMSSILNRITNGSRATAQPLDRLTDRELEVFELIGRGQTTREIGARLRLGLTTVDTYRARIKGKLNLENAARLHSEASRWLQQRE
ncbi:MAG TPA: response regulator transcription factor [Chthoniobacterales bacterium]|jgi:Response regulator containing a CheY-like receiver domain and an HTH DNA-binding domain|nr:response regulator transcription factor [Chthoniobacterales bacterium]